MPTTSARASSPGGLEVRSEVADDTPSDKPATRKPDATDNGRGNAGGDGGHKASLEANDPKANPLKAAGSEQQNLAKISSPDGKIALSNIYGHRDSTQTADVTRASENPTGTPSDSAKEAEKLTRNINNPESGLTDTQRAEMSKALDLLTQNKMIDARSGQEVDRRPPLSEEQKSKLLHETNRMFDQFDRIQDQGISKENRNAAVVSMLYDSTSPELMNQGKLNTCNVTSIGKIQALVNPGDQAEKFVDMYTNKNGDHTVTMPKLDREGKPVIGANGQPLEAKIQYDVNSLRMDNESAHAMDSDRVGRGEHDQFVKANDHLLVNTFTQQTRNQFYTMGQNSTDADSGERLHWGSFNGQLVRTQEGLLTNPGMGGNDVDNLERAFEASRHGGNLDGSRTSSLSNHAKYHTSGDISNINTIDDLNKAWDAHGGMPMIANVEAGSALLRNFTGGQSGGHALVIADRREVPGHPGQYEYKLDNSWGNKSNGWITAAQLVNTINPDGTTTPRDRNNGDDAPSDRPERLPRGLHYDGDRREGIVRDPSARGSHQLPGPEGIDPRHKDKDEKEKDGEGGEKEKDKEKKKAENDGKDIQLKTAQVENLVKAAMAAQFSDPSKARMLLEQVKAIEAMTPGVQIGFLPVIEFTDRTTAA